MKMPEWIRAIRKLPMKYVDDSIEVTPPPTTPGLHRLSGKLFVHHPKLETLVWKRGAKKWVEISESGNV